MAMPQHWFPDNLYNRAISVAVTNYSTCKNEFKALPYNVQFDIYYKVCIILYIILILIVNWQESILILNDSDSDG